MAYTPSQGFISGQIAPGGFNLRGATPGVLSDPKTLNVTSAGTNLLRYTPPVIPSPTNSSTGTVKKVTTTNNQGDKHEIVYDTTGGSNTGDTTDKPGDTNALGTHVLTQAELDAQNAKTAADAKTAATSFPGMIENLAKASNTGSATAPGYIQNTADYGAQNAATGQQAIDIAKQFGQQYADVGSQSAKFQAGQLTTGTTPVAEGNAAVTARTQAAQQTALAQGEQAALQGIGYQQSGLLNAANASNAAAGQAQTGQGLVQSGLTSAGTLAQPNATAQGQTTYNPLTNSFSGGSYSGNLQTVVDAIKSENMGYTDGVNSLASLSPTAKADVLKALGAGFDTVASDAKAGVRASNIGTGGTAGVQANQSVFNKAYGDYKTLENAVQNVDQFGTLLTQNMGGINPTDVRYANQTIAQIKSQLSSGQQAAFNSTLAALTSKVSGLLSVGGNEIPTDISAAANKIIDGSLPIGSLSTVLSRIQNEGNILLKNQADLVNSTYSGLQGTQQTNTNTGGSTGSITWDNVGD